MTGIETKRLAARFRYEIARHILFQRYDLEQGHKVSLPLFHPEHRLLHQPYRLLNALLEGHVPGIAAGIVGLHPKLYRLTRCTKIKRQTQGSEAHEIAVLIDHGGGKAQ